MTEPCADCGLALYENCDERGWLHLPDRKARRCPNYMQRAGERHLAEAAVPERFRDARLGTFKVEGMRGSRQLQAARDACVAFVRKPERGLLLWGNPGAGKSHLLAATLRAVLLDYPAMRGAFVEFHDLCSRIQATFGENYEGPSEREIVQPLLDCHFLVLDELGARRPSDFARDVLYLLLNGRYNKRLPVLASTNYDPAATGKDGLSGRLGGRAVSRLYEMCDIYPLDLVEDYRRTKKSVDSKRGA